MADRNFCTTRFVFGVASHEGTFLVREHASNVPWEALTPLQRCGTTTTGEVWEQTVRVRDPDTGATQDLRRLEVRLLEPTRDGDTVLSLLTNMPADRLAIELAELYRRRWTIETHFQFLTESLHCEVSGLGKPRAALFAFAMALLAGNALAVVRGTLRESHGREAEGEVSGYYLANDLSINWGALKLYGTSLDWRGWRSLEAGWLVALLVSLGGQVNLALLTRTKRGPKKPPADKPAYDPKQKHSSTARIIDDSC